MVSKKSFKICCIVSTTVIFLVTIALVILYFTIFKPKQPEIVATPVSLSHIQFTLFPNISLSLSIRTDVEIKNPNYAGFKYENSTTSVYYGGTFVGDAEIGEGMIGARTTEKIGTVVAILADKVIGSSRFLTDVKQGSLNMATVSNLTGKVILLGVFKLHAKTFTACDVSVFVREGNTTSTCTSKVKL